MRPEDITPEIIGYVTLIYVNVLAAIFFLSMAAVWPFTASLSVVHGFSVIILYIHGLGLWKRKD